MTFSTIGDHVELQRGTTYKSALLNQPGPFLLGLGSIARDGGFRPEKLKTYGGPSAEKILVYPGDLYVSLKDVTQSGDLLGSIARVPEDIAVGRMTQDTVKLCFKTDIPKSYFYWLLRTPQYRLHCRAHATGTTNLGLSRDDFFSFEIPELSAERERLTALLENLESKIDLLNRTNQTLEQIAQAIFKSWFVDFEPTRAKIQAKQNGQDPERAAMAVISGKSLEELKQLSPEQLQQLKTTAALFPDELVDSELGDIPDGWDISNIGDHINVTKGRSYKSSELQESTTALVTLKSFIRGGGYREDGLKEYTGTYKSEQVIKPGELVMSLTDVTQAAEIVGKPAIVTRNNAYETLVASLDVAILRPNNPVNKEFYYGLMSTYRFHRYAESFATGTTVLHLNPRGITSFEFANPDTKLCKIYSEIVSSMLAKHESNIHLSRSLEHLRNVLLPRLLYGDLVIDDELKDAVSD